MAATGIADMSDEVTQILQQYEQAPSAIDAPATEAPTTGMPATRTLSIVTPATGTPVTEPPASRSASTEAPPEDFDEEGYLRSYPDVAVAIRAGEFASGYSH